MPALDQKFLALTVWLSAMCMCVCVNAVCVCAVYVHILCVCVSVCLPRLLSGCAIDFDLYLSLVLAHLRFLAVFSGFFQPKNRPS